MQSNLTLATVPQSPPSQGLHVAIIMDGNGRWARARGLPRTAGHRAGSQAVRRIVEHAPQCGIDTLTLYAFSADNWKRPTSEVDALMRLMERYLLTECQRCVDNGVRLSVVGRRDRLEPRLVQTIQRVEKATAAGQTLHLRVAVDYSARGAIVAAAARFQTQAVACGGWGEDDLHRFGTALNATMHSSVEAGEVDLLIRTGGDQRLSDFMLWECAYAELLFVDRRWPDFTEEDLAAAVADFTGRERRFGQVGQAL